MLSQCHSHFASQLHIIFIIIIVVVAVAVVVASDADHVVADAVDFWF